MPIQDVLLSESESHSLEWKESNEALGKDGFVERMVDSALKGEIYQNILKIACCPSNLFSKPFFSAFLVEDCLRESLLYLKPLQHLQGSSGKFKKKK